MKIFVNKHEVFASTGGRHYDKSKPVIIFLHGSGFDHTVWMLQTRYFAFHGYSVLALDLPGHGLSKGECLKSIEDMAKWLDDVIKKLECKNVSLIGHSQGCLIALEYTSKYPKIIKSIALLGTSGKMPVNPILIKLAEENDSKVVDLMMDWSHGPAGKFSTHCIPGMNHVNIGSAIMKNYPLDSVLVNDLNACNNYTDGFESAKKITIPVLMILGDQDKMCSLKVAKEFGKNFKTNTIKVIKNCGHMMHLEAADKTLFILKNFIKNNFSVK